MQREREDWLFSFGWVKNQIGAIKTEKSRFSPLFMLGLLLVWMPSSLSQQPQGNIPPGDADGDGFVTALDRAVLLDGILGISDAPGNADFNSDGKVDIADLAGLIESFFEAEDSVVSVEVALSKEVVEPGGEVVLSWTIEGDRDVSELQVIVRARGPGHVVTTTDAVFATPGVIPANGDAYYLASNGNWGTTETVFGTGAAETEREVDVPSPAEGEWGFDVMVMDANGEPVGWGSRSLVAAQRAGMRLRLNRKIANTGDRVRIELSEFNRGEGGLVTPLVLLQLPDGQQLSLPDFSEELGFGESLQEDSSRKETLFDGVLPYGEGEYRLLARLYGEEGKIVSMASAGVLVCDSEAEISGVVRETGGGAVNGEEADFGLVEAFDLYDGVPVGSSAIAADGSYGLTVAAGVYVLQAARSEGEAYEEGTARVTVGCEGEALQVDIQLGEQTAQTSGRKALHFRGKQELAAKSESGPRRSMLGMLPPAGVLVRLVVPADFPDDKRRDLERRFASRTAQQNPEIALPTLSSIQDALAQASQMAYMGELDESLEQVNQVSENFAGYQFQCVVVAEQGGNNCQFSLNASCTDLHTAQTFKRANLDCFTEGELAQKVTDLANQTGGGGVLQQEANKRRTRPEQPFLKIRMEKDIVKPGDPLTVEVELLDLDFSPLEGEQIELENKSAGSLSIVEVPVGLTNLQGKVQVTLIASNSPGFGFFRANYESKFGKRAAEVKVDYQVDEQAGTNPGRFFVTNRGRLGLKPTETTDLELRLDTWISTPLPSGTAFLDLEKLSTDCSISGCPIVGTVPGQGGILSAPAVPMGPGTPTASVQFEAGSMRGLVRVTGQFTCSVCDPSDTLLKDDALVAIDGDVKLSVSVGGAGGAGLATAKPYTGPVPLQASIIVGDSLVEAQAVQFSIQGNGGLTATNTQTNAFGLAGTTFVAPNDTGTTQVTARAVVEGETYTEMVDIEYEPAPVSVITLPIPFQQWGSVGLNNLGQVVSEITSNKVALWLPEPDHGLPQGTTELGMTTATRLYGGGALRFAYPMNDSGQVLGTDDDGNPVYWENGVISRIVGLGADIVRGKQCCDSGVVDLNNGGEITGWIYKEVDGDILLPYAFRGSLKGGISLLPEVTTAGGEFGDGHIGVAINDSGVIVAHGTSWPDSADENARQQLIRFTGSQGSLVANFDGMIKNAEINESGQIVVHTWPSFSPRQRSYFLENGTTTELLGLPSTNGMEACDLNDQGVVVGQAREDLPDTYRGFVWFNGKMEDINDLIPDEVFSTHLVICLAVNNDNQVVCEDQNRQLYLISGLPITP